MSTVLEKKQEYVLTRAQFNQLLQNQQLQAGSIYSISDDPTAYQLIDGTYSALKAIQDGDGNIISETYLKSADIYTKSEIDALLPKTKVIET